MEYERLSDLPPAALLRHQLALQTNIDAVHRKLVHRTQDMQALANAQMEVQREHALLMAEYDDELRAADKRATALEQRVASLEDRLLMAV